MAQWNKVTSKGNVEDRRGMTPAVVGGVSLTGIALLFVFNALSGGTTEDFLGDVFQMVQEQPTQQQVATNEYDGVDAYEQFAVAVLGSADAFWSTMLASERSEYVEPTLILFRQATTSACGTASSAVGPHYCPLDNHIYLDETFFEELTRRYGAESGDLAQAYVIAHEVGHHVQNMRGTLSQLHNTRSTEEQQRLSIATELQADCYAGLWAGSLKDQGILERGDIQEALSAAAAVGDDKIQETVTGRVNPESWTHGSSEQRVEWFMKGYEGESMEVCDF
ncbi:MAG: neutral zinc metallopeptidase [Pseudomonadales bacterium]|nr:neutral zinc metallopeptidase [Candidatus Woesebacteria bacterium]MCB9801624.1 neutral zinc metallopeptidase [Pseudomonadales bacterium]